MSVNYNNLNSTMSENSNIFNSTIHRPREDSTHLPVTQLFITMAPELRHALCLPEQANLLVLLSSKSARPIKNTDNSPKLLLKFFCL